MIWKTAPQLLEIFSCQGITLNSPRENNAEPLSSPPMFSHPMPFRQCSPSLCFQDSKDSNSMVAGTSILPGSQGQLIDCHIKSYHLYQPYLTMTPTLRINSKYHWNTLLTPSLNPIYNRHYFVIFCWYPLRLGVTYWGYNSMSIKIYSTVGSEEGEDPSWIS